MLSRRSRRERARGCAVVLRSTVTRRWWQRPELPILVFQFDRDGVGGNPRRNGLRGRGEDQLPGRRRKHGFLLRGRGQAAGRRRERGRSRLRIRIGEAHRSPPRPQWSAGDSGRERAHVDVVLKLTVRRAGGIDQVAIGSSNSTVIGLEAPPP